MGLRLPDSDIKCESVDDKEKRSKGQRDGRREGGSGYSRYIRHLKHCSTHDGQHEWAPPHRINMASLREREEEVQRQQSPAQSQG